MALILAAQEGHSAVVKMLLEYPGIEVNVRNNDVSFAVFTFSFRICVLRSSFLWSPLVGCNGSYLGSWEESFCCCKSSSDTLRYWGQLAQQCKNHDCCNLWSIINFLFVRASLGECDCSYFGSQGRVFCFCAIASVASWYWRQSELQQSKFHEESYSAYVVAAKRTH